MTDFSDKAGEEYWTKVWAESELSPAIHVHDRNVNDYPYRVLHQYYLELFKNFETKDKTLLEIGCGNSAFLTYFAREFGFQVAGLDYSQIGCEQSRQILKRDGVEGTIYLADAFAPPAELLNRFDVVCSFGVVEHFTDTSKVIRAFSQFVKPGGILITSVPNLAGVTGFLQKVMNRPVYDIHVPMDKPYLDRAIENAGLDLVSSKYFVSVSFAVTLEPKSGKLPYLLPKKLFLKTIRYLSKVLWMAEDFIGSLPEGKLLSAGIITAAKRK